MSFSPSAAAKSLRATGSALRVLDVRPIRGNGVAERVISPVDDALGRSPGAGLWSSRPRGGQDRHQHMTAVSPEPHAQYRRTRTT